MPYLRYVCLLSYSVAQYILHCLFCFACLLLLYPMLLVVLNCPFLIASSGFSNVSFIVILYTPSSLQWTSITFLFYMYLIF